MQTIQLTNSELSDDFRRPKFFKTDDLKTWWIESESKNIISRHIGFEWKQESSLIEFFYGKIQEIKERISKYCYTL